jgi:hypothetical protein
MGRYAPLLWQPIRGNLATLLDPAVPDRLAEEVRLLRAEARAGNPVLCVTDAEATLLARTGCPSAWRRPLSQTLLTAEYRELERQIEEAPQTAILLVRDPHCPIQGLASPLIEHLRQGYAVVGETERHVLLRKLTRQGPDAAVSRTASPW